jgi:hypothetical protein
MTRIWPTPKPFLRPRYTSLTHKSKRDAASVDRTQYLQKSHDMRDSSELQSGALPGELKRLSCCFCRLYDSYSPKHAVRRRRKERPIANSSKQNNIRSLSHTIPPAYLHIDPDEYEQHQAKKNTSNDGKNNMCAYFCFHPLSSKTYHSSTPTQRW